MRYLFLLLITFSVNLHAQDLKPNGQFLADTVKIGEKVGYSLSLRYPRELDVVFPDSLYDFSPYELVDKKFFPTISNDSTSYDSAVYYISTFEIDTIQYLELPIFVLHGNDSTVINATKASFALRQLVAEIPDSVSAEAAPLIENTTYIKVPTQFNLPYFIIGSIILILILILIYVFFGKKIKSALIIRKLKKKHRKFIETFENLRTKQNDSNSKLAENIIMHWKKYLEKLENRPYTKLTTKEIVVQYNLNQIEKNLKGVDRSIYANIPNNSNLDYDALKLFAQQQFENKIKEVNHG